MKSSGVTRRQLKGTNLKLQYLPNLMYNILFQWRLGGVVCEIVSRKNDEVKTSCMTSLQSTILKVPNLPFVITTFQVAIIECNSYISSSYYRMLQNVLSVTNMFTCEKKKNVTSPCTAHNVHPYILHIYQYHVVVFLAISF